MLKLLQPAEFKLEARHGRLAGAGVQTSAPLTAVNEKSRTARFVFSSGAVDRMGDTLNPLGWVLSDFRRNPVALFAHDQRSLPIGRARNVEVTGDALVGDIEFAPGAAYPFAETCWQMVRSGFMPAVSVGFLPLEYAWAKGPGRVGGIDFLRQALLEISCVPVPAHQSALLVGASADKAKARAKRQRELDLLVLRHGP